MATNTETGSSISPWVEDPLKRAAGSAEDWLNSSSNYTYGTKAGESLFTPLSDNQNWSIQNIRDIAGGNYNATFGYDGASDLWKKFASSEVPLIGTNWGSGAKVNGGGVSGQINVGNYGVQGPALTTERVVDENGWLGKISDWINPYLKQVLDPQLRELREQTERDRRTIGASQTMAGAFGDARHGVMEGQLVDNANRNAQDLTGQAYYGAYNDAMGRRASDIGRYDALGQFNTGVAENAASRKLSAEQTNMTAMEQAISRALQADMTNASMAEAAKQRDLTAAMTNQSQQARQIDNMGTAAAGLGQNANDRYNLFSNINDSLFNAGAVEQGKQEEMRQVMQKFIEDINKKKLMDATTLRDFLTGVPNSTSSTSKTTNKSEASGSGMLASALAALFG